LATRSANCATTLFQPPPSPLQPGRNRHSPCRAGIYPAMVIEAIPPVAAETERGIADALLQLGEILIARGALDYRTLDRARRVTADTGGRLDRVLTQLGMVSERDLAEALAELVGSVLISPADYPEAPLFVDRLKPKFLHKARALPIADTPDNVILAMADPLDGFVSGSIAAA